MNLTDEEIRIKVHKALGWTERKEGPTHYAWSRGDYWHYLHEVPNYPEDLNACAEFEKTLTDEEHGAYIGWLRCLINEELYQGEEQEWTWFDLITATARQRSIAFLKTKGILP